MLHLRPTAAPAFDRSVRDPISSLKDSRIFSEAVGNLCSPTEISSNSNFLSHLLANLTAGIVRRLFADAKSNACACCHEAATCRSRC